MSLFFDGERRPKVTPVVVPPDWEIALQFTSKRYDPHVVAAHAHISVEQARELAQTCRRLEPMLLAAIQSGEITTQTSASTFIQDNTEGFFPRAKFIQLLKERVGTEAAPATWAQVVAAAQAEDLG